jgi:hypothetical protein
LAAVFAVIGAIAGSLPAAEKPRKQKPVESYALVAGTVFREPGFALPGAEVILTAAPDAPSNGPRVKKQKAATDGRGEFAFRVPPEGMKYVVMVSAKGMKNQEKTVSVQGEERVEVTFMLAPESNK